MDLCRHTLVLAAALGITLTAPAVQAQPKIAVVDMQRALNETEDGRKAKAKLKKMFEQRQRKLDSKQQELKKLKQGIEKQRKVLSKDALAKKLETYQKKMLELQQSYMDYQRELQSQESDLTGHIIARMQAILRRIGQKEGYTLILERGEGGVVFVPSHLDLTDVLIQRYNAGKGKKAAKKKGKK